MDWDILFNMQKELDIYIEENNGIKKADLLDKKILALLVEAGELANETKCFKFWSKKQPSEKEIILEEYVDGFHFLLSIGLDKDYTFSSLETKEKSLGLTEQFNQFFTSIISFKQRRDINTYKEMFKEYLVLGNILGFSADDIFQAYTEKNEINHQRQDSDY